MLELSRHTNEKVLLHYPDGTRLGTITVREVAGDKVRLGFDFPREIGIVRPDAVRKTPRPAGEVKP